jgi:hypothetical protein
MALLAVLALALGASAVAALAPPQPGLAGLGAGAKTSAALAQARDALLGYAAADPNRPGELPCPDADGDGRSTPPQDYAGSRCRTRRGWLPWYTLRLPDLRDGAGERLWYALSDDYHAGARAALNSDTPGRLGVDGAGGLVAVVLAPGAALPGQARASGGAADAVAAQYLEGPNAAAEPAHYVDTPPGGNDRLIALARADLMRGVEGRVLGEVVRALDEYVAGAEPAGTGAFPWLVPATAPVALPGVPVPGVRAGRLPHHVPGGEFATGFALESWVFEGGLVRLAGPPGNTVRAEDLTRGGALVVTAQAGGRCTWRGVRSVHCRGAVEQACAVTGGACPLPAGVSRRLWSIDLAFEGGPALRAPTARGLGVRDVRLVGGPLPAQLGPTLRVTDYAPDGRVLGQGAWHAGDPSLVTGAAGARATLVVRGIRWYPELPAWFAENAWDRYLRVAYAAAAAPGAGGTCGAGIECLTVVDRGGRSSPQAANGVLLLAGAALAPPPAGPGAPRPGECPDGASCGALEEENADGDDVYLRGPPAPNFNDRVAILGPGR